jgi:DNA-binding NarL/FixJ family response regulator
MKEVWEKGQEIPPADDEQVRRLWRALAAGQLSIVDRFDRDGRRFLLARRGRADSARRSALSEREWRVAGYAAMGYASKTIAFNLGIAWSTVAERLRSAMTKLGISSRAELIQLFNPTGRGAL